jgi:hypothetical protein
MTAKIFEQDLTLPPKLELTIQRHTKPLDRRSFKCFLSKLIGLKISVENPSLEQIQILFKHSIRESIYSLSMNLQEPSLQKEPLKQSGAVAHTPSEESFPRLETLKLTVGAASSPLATQLVKRCPSLKSMRLQAPKDLPLQEFIESAPKGIQNMHLRQIEAEKGSVVENFFNWQTFNAFADSFKNLQRLKLTSIHKGRTKAVCLMGDEPIYRQNPHLKTLVLTGLNLNKSALTEPHYQAPLCPELSQLELRSVIVNDLALFHIISHCPKLQQIEFKASCYIIDHNDPFSSIPTSIISSSGKISPKDHSFNWLTHKIREIFFSREDIIF